MTKDGIRDKVSRDLHRLYDGVLRERVPDDMLRLVERAQ